MPQCVYDASYSAKPGSEHLFPEGLGGSNERMTCVSQECNKYFSKLERRLIRSVPLGLMRAAEEPLGYRKGKRWRSLLDDTEYFAVDRKNGITFEAGLAAGFKEFLRPQLIIIHGTIYMDGPDQEHVNIFLKTFYDWWLNSQIVAFYPPTGSVWQAYKFRIENGKVEYHQENITKVKGVILCAELQDKEFKEGFGPRLFMGDNDDLWARSVTHAESLEMVKLFLESFIISGTQVKSFPDLYLEEFKVSAGSLIPDIGRALVKIGLNSLMHKFEHIRYHSALDAPKSFVMGKTDSYLWEIDSIKYPPFDFNKSIHYIIFHQVIDGIFIKISFFGGSFKIRFPIKDLFLGNYLGAFLVMEINFNNKQHSYMSFDAFCQKQGRDYYDAKARGEI